MRVEAPPLHTVVSRTCSWAERSLAFRQGRPTPRGYPPADPAADQLKSLRLRPTLAAADPEASRFRALPLLPLLAAARHCWGRAGEDEGRRSPEFDGQFSLNTRPRRRRPRRPRQQHCQSRAT